MTDDAERAEKAAKEAAEAKEKADKAARDAGQATEDQIEQLRRERAQYDERVSRESAEREVAAAEVTHEVQPGDTLSGIAEQFGVNSMEIDRANGIENPDLIYPGQVFTIPK